MPADAHRALQPGIQNSRDMVGGALRGVFQLRLLPSPPIFSFPLLFPCSACFVSWCVFRTRPGPDFTPLSFSSTTPQHSPKGLLRASHRPGNALPCNLHLIFTENCSWKSLGTSISRVVALVGYGTTWVSCVLCFLHMCIYGCACIWRLEVDIRSFLSHSRPLTEPGTEQLG